MPIRAVPTTRTSRFNDLNGNKLFDGTAGARPDGDWRLDVKNSFGGTSTTVDPNLKNSYTDEFDLSYDRQFWGESAIRVAYVRKIEKNLYTTINIARIGAYTVPTTGDASNLRTTRPPEPSPTGSETLTLFDIPSGLTGVSTESDHEHSRPLSAVRPGRTTRSSSPSTNGSAAGCS